MGPPPGGPDEGFECSRGFVLGLGIVKGRRKAGFVPPQGEGHSLINQSC